MVLPQWVAHRQFQLGYFVLLVPTPSQSCHFCVTTRCRRHRHCRCHRLLVVCLFVGLVWFGFLFVFLFFCLCESFVSFVSFVSLVSLVSLASFVSFVSLVSLVSLAS